MGHTDNMLKPNSILKNSAFLMAGNLIQRFISFFVGIQIIRYLGPVKYGQFTFVIAFITIASLLWNFGLDTLFVRDVSRDKSLTASYSGQMIIIKSILIVLAVPFILLYLKFLDYEKNVIIAVFIFTLTDYLRSLYLVFEAEFKAFQRMEFISLLNIIRPVVLLLSVIVVTTILGGVKEIFLCYLISYIVVFLSSLFLIKKYFVKPVFSIKISEMITTLKSSLSLFLITVVNIILFRIDHLMLSKMKGDASLGLYGSVYTIFEVIIAFFPIMIMSATFPVLSEKFKNDLSGMKNLYNLLMKYLLFLGIPISIGIILISDSIVVSLFGKEYLGAAKILSVLGGSIWIFFLTFLISWTLTAIEKQNYVLVSNFIALILNVVLNFYFIPKYGAMAAAITTLTCEFIQLLIMFTVLKETLHVQYQLNLIKILLSSLVMGIILLILKKYVVFSHPIVNLTFFILISTIIFFGIAFILKTVKKDEFKLIISS